MQAQAAARACRQICANLLFGNLQTLPALIKTAAMHNHTVFIIYFRFVLLKPNPAEQRRTFDFTILPLPLVLLMVVCKSVIPGSMLHTQ